MDVTTHPLQHCSQAEMERAVAQALSELTDRFAEVVLQAMQCSSGPPDCAGVATLQLQVRFRHPPEPEGEGPTAEF